MLTGARAKWLDFGLVLYEMLSGQRAFQCDTAADSLSAILKDEPAELPETVPAHIRQLIQHCLEKEPANRFQSAKDLAVALNAGPVETPRSKPAPKKLWPYALAAATLLAGIITGAAIVDPPIDIATQHHRLVVSRVTNYAMPNWAPDGKSFVQYSREHHPPESRRPWPESAASPKRIHPELVFGGPNSNADWLTNDRHLLLAYSPRSERLVPAPNLPSSVTAKRRPVSGSPAPMDPGFAKLPLSRIWA